VQIHLSLEYVCLNKVVDSITSTLLRDETTSMSLHDENILRNNPNGPQLWLQLLAIKFLQMILERSLGV
jgi:hypothetical protein